MNALSKLRWLRVPQGAARVLTQWPFGPKRAAELRSLQRRLAAARLGVESPRWLARQLPYEDLQ
jgi:hypothetical protein